MWQINKLHCEQQYQKPLVVYLSTTRDQKKNITQFLKVKSHLQLQTRRNRKFAKSTRVIQIQQTFPCFLGLLIRRLDCSQFLVMLRFFLFNKINLRLDKVESHRLKQLNFSCSLKLETFSVEDATLVRRLVGRIRE